MHFHFKFKCAAPTVSHLLDKACATLARGSSPKTCRWALLPGLEARPSTASPTCLPRAQTSCAYEVRREEPIEPCHPSATGCATKAPHANAEALPYQAPRANFVPLSIHPLHPLSLAQLSRFAWDPENLAPRFRRVAEERGFLQHRTSEEIPETLHRILRMRTPAVLLVSPRRCPPCTAANAPRHKNRSRFGTECEETAKQSSQTRRCASAQSFRVAVEESRVPFACVQFGWWRAPNENASTSPPYKTKHHGIRYGFRCLQHSRLECVF